VFVEEFDELCEVGERPCQPVELASGMLFGFFSDLSQHFQKQ
jgi:hypothetical protein